MSGNAADDLLADLNDSDDEGDVKMTDTSKVCNCLAHAEGWFVGRQDMRANSKRCQDR